MPATLRTLDYLINESTGTLKDANNITAAQMRDAVASMYQLDYSADTSIPGTATATIGKWHICTGTTSDYTLTLPAASGNSGKMIGLRMSSALTKLVTIDGNGAETIDGATTRVMWANEVAVLFCDGTGWTKIAGKTIPMNAMLVATSAQTITNGTFAAMDLPSAVYDVGAMADTANDQVVIRRAGNYVCLGNFSVASTSAGEGSLIGCILHNSASIRVGRSATYSGNTFSVSGGLSIVAAAGDTVKAQRYYYDSATTDRATEYINPDSRCFLIVTEVPSW